MKIKILTLFFFQLIIIGVSLESRCPTTMSQSETTLLEKKYDIVVYGATGFTGRLVALYFASMENMEGRWAIAGRNQKKLESLQKELKEKAHGLTIPYFVADSKDPQAIDFMTSNAKVLVNTAGPFSLFGEPIVASCVKNSTDYVDITGESPYVRKLIDLHHETALEKGVRIIPCCGFDSIPSDIGTLYVVDSMRKKWGQPCKEVDAIFDMKGEINGGSWATAVALSRDKENSKKATNPYYLNPDPHNKVHCCKQHRCKRKFRDKDQGKPCYNTKVKKWTAPFIMATVNTRVVRRSQILAKMLQQDYGESFSYRESMLADKNGSFFRALYTSAGISSFKFFLNFSWFQNLVLYTTSKPGSSPTEEEMDSGFFDCCLIGTSVDNRCMEVHFSSKGDPGYRCTVKMICESALHLVETDRDQLPGGSSYGGVLTPATGLGLGMVKRLRDVGMTIE